MLVSLCLLPSSSIRGFEPRRSCFALNALPRLLGIARFPKLLWLTVAHLQLLLRDLRR